MFHCIQEAIDIFKNKHESFFDQEGLTTVSVNALCMVTACFIQSCLSHESLELRIKMLEDIMDMNKRYLMEFDRKDKLRSMN